MVKTFKDLQDLDNVVGAMYQKDVVLKDTKFGYAYKRFCDKFYIPAIKELNEEINNARVDNALENPTTKEVLTDPANPRGFKYSKEGLKKVMEQEKNLRDVWDKKEIEVQPFISSYVPEDITEEQKEILTGVLL